MDLIRKERNLLLSRATEKNATEKNATEKNEAREDKHKDDDTLSLASSYRNDTGKEKEKQDFLSYLALYESFLTWIQSSDLLSDQQVFKYSFSDQNEENVSGQLPIPKRVSLSFESLSPPSKNLILALGDVHLQKTSAEEIHLNSLFHDLSSMAKSLWLTVVSARSSLQKKIMESTEKRVDIEAKLLSEMFSSPEYVNAISEIESMERALQIEIKIPNATSLDKSEVYKNVCQRNRTITKCLHKVSHPTPVKDDQKTVEFQSTALLSEIDQRLKLRIRKNEISKQKLLELSKTSTSASNLTIALDTLRIAEQEMDESILILNNSISNSKGVLDCIKEAEKKQGKDEREEGEEGEEGEEDEKVKTMNFKKDEIFELFSKHKSISLILSCIGVKLRLLKTSIDDEIVDERNKYQSELTSLISRECSTNLDYVKDIILTKQTLFTNDLKKLGKSETTLKSELQSLLRIVRNDSRAVEQCVRSVTETAKSRSDQIQKSHFFRHVTFLRHMTQDTTMTNAVK